MEDSSARQISFRATLANPILLQLHHVANPHMYLQNDCNSVKRRKEEKKIEAGYLEWFVEDFDFSSSPSLRPFESVQERANLAQAACLLDLAWVGCVINLKEQMLVNLFFSDSDPVRRQWRLCFEIEAPLQRRQD